MRDALIRTTLTYALHTTQLKATAIDQIEGFANNFIRKILYPTWHREKIQLYATTNPTTNK